MGKIPGNFKFNSSSGDEDAGGLLRYLRGLLAKQESKVIISQALSCRLE